MLQIRKIHTLYGWSKKRLVDETDGGSAILDELRHKVTARYRLASTCRLSPADPGGNYTGCPLTLKCPPRVPGLRVKNQLRPNLLVACDPRCAVNIDLLDPWCVIHYLLLAAHFSLFPISNFTTAEISQFRRICLLLSRV
ncbi:hypothetical protein J6590_068112 [Homalodisca vitripennis]|nr:hypothetical protein J6590_068112 [Homalodisca vitripennis]